MRRRLPIILAILLFVGCTELEYDDSADYPQLKLWMEKLCSEEFGGRKTASVGDSLACDFLLNELKQMKYDTELQRFRTDNGFVFRNVIVTIEGISDSIVVIGSHYDGACQSDGYNHYPAANDNASGVVVNLGFLDTLRNSVIRPYYTLKCCFWDGEESFDGRCFRGSSYFLDSYDSKGETICYINFDSVGHRHDLYVRYQGGNQVKRVLNSLEKNSRFVYVGIDMNDLSEGGSDYVPFSEAGIPYLSFGDHNGNMCHYASHSVNDTPKAISFERLNDHILNMMDIIGFPF